MTPHTPAQHANSLAAVAAIQRKHDIMRDERYSVAAYDAAIVYFEALMKHLNARGKVGIAEAALLDSYFDEWHEDIENMLCVQEPFIS